MVDPPPLRGDSLKHNHKFSEAFLQDVCTAFTQAQHDTREHDVWSEISGHSAQFEAAMRAHDLEAVEKWLATMFQSNLLIGMAHCAIMLTDKSPYGKAYFGTRVRDSLLALAEALAIKGIESNHQTSFAEHLRLTNGDLSPLVDRIEDVLGHSIKPVDFGQPAVADMNGQMLNPDYLRHAYAMYRIETLGFSKTKPILEIGGGFGCVTRYGIVRGFKDLTIIDLPFANAVQAGFIAGTEGEDVVQFHQQVSGKAKSGQSGKVILWPSTKKDQLSRKFELAINMDSLPEINRDEALSYLKLLKKKAKYFWSVNQEAEKTTSGGMKQNRVSQLVDEIGGFRRLHRHPYWMEQGYVEELYEIVE